MQSPERAPNPYALLGISFGASSAEIKQAYRRAVQKYHPDRHLDDPSAHRRFVEIQTAYEWILAHPNEDYEKVIETSFHPITPEPPVEFKKTEGPKEGDVSTIVFIRLSEVVKDVQKIVSVKVLVLCHHCGGMAINCLRCSGTGQVLQKKKYRFNIPAGTLDGTWVIGRALGHQGAQKKGDVWVQIKWSQMGIWNWDGERLVGKLFLSHRQMIKGGQFPLRLPSGNWIWCTIPPQTKPDQIFKWDQLPWSPLHHQAWLQVKRGQSFLSLPSRR